MEKFSEKASEFSTKIPDTCIVLQICNTRLNTFALTTSGYVYSWGELTYALGREPQLEIDKSRPLIIEGLMHKKVINLACGDDHVLALTDDGFVYSWGNNKYGQLGLGDVKGEGVPIPTLVENLHYIDKEVDGVKIPTPPEKQYYVVRISAGIQYSFALVKKTVEGNDNYITYVWGRNENIMLRRINTKELKKSTEPVKVLQPAWGNLDPNITIRPNKRGKNYAYRSVIGNDLHIGTFTEEGIKDIESENNHLKRRLQMLTDKVKREECEVYGNDVSLQSDGLKNDKILRNIQKVLDLAEKAKLNSSKTIIENKTELETIEKAINDIEVNLIKHNDDEEREREEIAKLEDELKYAVIKLDVHSHDYVTEVKHINELRIKIGKYSDTYIKSCEEKGKLQNSIIDKNEELKAISNIIKKQNLKLDEANRRIKIFKSIKAVREQQTIFNFFEQSQKGVNKEIENFKNIYDAINDASVESLSRSIQKNSMSEYLNYSNMLLEQMQADLIHLRKPEKNNPAYIELNKIWNIMDDHIKLLLDKNCLEEGLLQQTVCNVFESKAQSDDTEEVDAQRTLMKKILIKSNLSQFQSGEALETKKTSKSQSRSTTPVHGINSRSPTPSQGLNSRDLTPRQVTNSRDDGLGGDLKSKNGASRLGVNSKDSASRLGINNEGEDSRLGISNSAASPDQSLNSRSRTFLKK